MQTRPILLIGFLAISLPVHAQLLSAYSSVDLKECVAEDSWELRPKSEQTIDFYTGECPGFGGYRVFISGSDMRYALEIRHAEHVVELRRPPGFHDMGASKIEWRYEVAANQSSRSRNGRSLQYRSLIYRLNYQDNMADGSSRKRTELVVVRLQGANTCVVGLVSQGAEMNLKARQVADNLSLPCLKL